MVFLIPTTLADGRLETLPAYVLDAVKQCTVFFVEDQRTARRFLKSLWKEMVIDDYQWYTIHKAEAEQVQAFTQHLQNGQHIAIISEAGCPAIADPGQLLVAAAQALQVVVRPLVGPSAILLALMASGLNGNSFCFNGYLPIDAEQRGKTLQLLEAEAIKKNTTHIFIETPYRNNALVAAILQYCKPTTRLCIGVNITHAAETIQTKTVGEWKLKPPHLAKIPAIFLLGI